MYDVQIINNEAILFDGIEVNLECLRYTSGYIYYEFEDGNTVRICPDNFIIWCDSNGNLHREGDMPAFIGPDGYMAYYKNNKCHREYGPAIIYSSDREKYWLDSKRYAKKDYINKLNSNYGCIYHV